MSLKSRMLKCIEDLRYEPFELMSDSAFQILDDRKNHRLIFKNFRKFEDKAGFIGQCEELSYITAKRIRQEFPKLRVQVYAGRDQNNFNIPSSHKFVKVIVDSMFKSTKYIIDPSYGVLGNENDFKYLQDELMYDSSECDGVIGYVDGYLPYDITFPVLYERLSKQLFSMAYDNGAKQFKFIIGKHVVEEHNDLAIATNNSKFLEFCKNINNLEITPLQGEFIPQEQEVWF